MQLKDVTRIIKAILEERDKIQLMINTERYIPDVKLNQYGATMRGGLRKALRIIEQAPVIDAVPREEYKRLECELATMKAYMRYIAVELPNPCRFCVHNEAGKVCDQECYGQGLEHFAFEWRGLPDNVFEKMEERKMITRLNMTRLEKLNAEAAADNHSKIILGIRMPDGSKEIIVNDNVAAKVEYIGQKYDDDLRMKGAPITIEEYLLIKA